MIRHTHILALVFILGFQHTEAAGSQAIAVKKVSTKKICVIALAAMTFIPALEVTNLTISGAYHDRAAAKQNKEHLGHGIYLDMEKIVSLLSPSERELLKNPIGNAEKIAQMFTIKLFGDYDKKFAQDFNILDNGVKWATARDASEFLEGQSKERGVCRHKVIILRAILNHLGIDAVVQLGHSKINGGHAWIYLPKLQRYSDPTNADLALRLHHDDPLLTESEMRIHLKELKFDFDKDTETPGNYPRSLIRGINL